jgi:hypothetical protein
MLETVMLMLMAFSVGYLLGYGKGQSDANGPSMGEWLTGNSRSVDGDPGYRASREEYLRMVRKVQAATQHLTHAEPDPPLVEPVDAPDQWAISHDGEIIDLRQYSQEQPKDQRQDS